MGRGNRCFVELATKSLSSEQVQKVEDICNDLIRITPDSPDMETVSSSQEEALGDLFC